MKNTLEQCVLVVWKQIHRSDQTKVQLAKKCHTCNDDSEVFVRSDWMKLWLAKKSHTCKDNVPNMSTNVRVHDLH